MGNELFRREDEGVGLGIGEVEDDIAALKAKGVHSSDAEGADKYGSWEALEF